MGKAAKFTRALAPVALVCAPLIVALAPAGATTSVSTEAQLRTAFGNASETSVSITADITLSNCGAGVVTRTSANAITVEGNGHTVHQTCNTNSFQQTSSGNITFNDLVIAMHGGHDAVDAGSGSTVTLNNVSIPNVNDGDGVSASGNVVMNNSSMSGIGDGDGVSTGGNVTMVSSTIAGITTGDGLSNGGTDTLTDSEISGQIGSQDCDGISTGGAVTLTRSSIIGCDDGISNGGAVTLTNSTLADASSNGISTGGTVTLTFSTLVGNHTAINAAGLISTGSAITGGATNNCSVSGEVSHGYNFSDDASCGFDQSTDQSDAGDPMLHALADNGGPTRTFLPFSGPDGGALVDKVPAGSCTVSVDQRGVTRPQNGACEIGAVEVEVATTPTTAPGGGSTAPPASPVSANPSLTG